MSFRANGGSQNFDISALRGIPMHIVMAFQRDGADGTTFTARCWVNKVLRATRAAAAYPFADPYASGATSIYPQVGAMTGGFTTGFRGKYHRGGVGKVPVDFSDAEIASWIAERYDAINPPLVA